MEHISDVDQYKKNFIKYTIFLCSLLSVIVVKVIFFIFVEDLSRFLTGGGNDSDYYHLYATRGVDVSINLWNDILRGLYDLGLYSRSGINLVLKALSIVIVPSLVVALVCKNRSFQGWYSLVIFFTIGCYPTLFYLSFDIYRDVFMVFVYLVTTFFIDKAYSSQSLFYKLIFFVLVSCLCLVLFELRHYLGFSVFLAFLVIFLFDRIRLSLPLLLFIYLMLLWAAAVIGLLDPLLDYRQNFLQGVLAGGSNLDIDFADRNLFLYQFLKSFLAQVLGVHFINYYSVVLFILESIPFVCFSIYVCLNMRFSNRLVRFLIVFFLIYTSLWVIGNDNLGSAIRLRIFSYLAMLICFFIIYGRKRKILR